ncbi:MAG: aspartate/glutamate racemase family protein [Bacillaceae bacterium]|nr:aspartate/glutamate racemase family protein [Bacillaceae bacterium]
MKTIGLIGGMSWESSLEYYRLINQLVKEELGGLHSAQSLMYSVDFEEIERYQREDKWDKATDLLKDIACRLEKAGADLLLICSNTMHKMAEDVRSSIAIPLIHIGEATADAIEKKEMKRVGLLGTKYTMEQDFYMTKLMERGIEVLIPEKEQRQCVNRVIFEELCRGDFFDTSKEAYIQIIQDLAERGAEGIILGCTEIPLLIKQEDSPVPLFDTTYIHAKKAVEIALGADYK